MFNDAVVATTAISSFNNAALYGPFFLVAGLFTMPLLFVVYLYADNFAEKFGFTHNPNAHIGFFASLFLALYLMLFGGNYAVIRDGISLVPIMIGLILFVFMAIAAQKFVQLGYVNKLRNKKLQFFVFVALVLMAGFSGLNTWWGILLQISAVLCGIIVGSREQRDLPLVPVFALMLDLVLILVLMQPEFFRFGQLGNLTIVHLLAMVISGFFAIGVFTNKYINARARIHHSAYIKLKWLFRIMLLLAFVLFVSTESVPVFIGLTLSMGLLQALTIYHSKSMNPEITKQSFAVLLICVGTILICPVVSALGILYLATIKNKAKVAEFLRLL